MNIEQEGVGVETKRATSNTLIKVMLLKKVVNKVCVIYMFSIGLQSCYNSR